MNKELEANTNLSHYRIVEKIGVGGMGEVYLAQDLRLDRSIALKILPADLAADPERMRRFVLEAKATSALNHPNIITIYEIGAEGETNFIAAEYIEGETLRERLKANSFSADDCLEVAVQITSALQAAHAVNIVHRDIKPENIMIRPDGFVKILDFGIAKLTEKKTEITDAEAATKQQAQTALGMIIGTAAYMSPEQAQGKAVDARSDIFSLGVVLYEMLAGRQPFEGENAIDVIGRILHKEPTSLSQLLPEIPAELERIINKALCKDCPERYQTAKDLLVDLKELKQELDFQSKLKRAAQPGKETEAQTQIIKVVTGENDRATRETTYANSIAVLPFSNLSNDVENEYFCDGLAEELLNALAKIEDLKVAARTSAFSFRGKNTKAGEIGNVLNVRTILEGSVRKSGNKLRITVQLINAADGYHLWSERYDREMRDIFDVQDEITLAIVDALRLKLFGEEKAALLKRGTDNTEAYECYLKGLYHNNKYTPEGWRRAIEYFDEAIRQEPEYAAAFAAKARCQHYLYYYAVAAPDEIVDQWRATTTRALELDEQAADAHLSLAKFYFYRQRDWAQAEREFKRAIELNPNSADARQFYGMFLASRERMDEAVREGEIALELDPLSLPAKLHIGWIYWSANRFDETLRQVERMIEIEPNFFGAYFHLGTANLGTGKRERAVEAFQKSFALNGTTYILSFLGWAYALAGKREEAFAVINQLLDAKKQQFTPAFNIARVYGGLSETDKTYEWLERAIEERNGELVYLDVVSKAGGGSLWGKDFRADSRFESLMRRINSPTDDGNKFTNEANEARTAILPPVKTDDDAVLPSTGGIPNNDTAVPPDVRKSADFPAGDSSKITGGYRATVEAQPQEIVENNLAERHSLSAPQTAEPLKKSDLVKESNHAGKHKRLLIIGLITALLAAIGFAAFWYLSNRSTKQINSIAILPFENASGNADLDYLSDGVSESVIDRLSQLPQLKVIARSSSFRYRGQNLNLQEIANTLGVQAIVTGRVVPRGDSYQIRVELVDVRENKQLWGENFTRKALDVQILQTDISREIAENLRFRLSGAQTQRLAIQGTTNPQAYELLLKGRFWFNKAGVTENFHKAVEYWEQAIAVDPNYALAYAELSDGYFFGGRGLDIKQRQTFREAAARKALELDPNLAEAHFAMAGAKSDAWEWKEAGQEYKRAIELNPNLASAHNGYASYLRLMGRNDEALTEVKRALEINPLSLIINANLGSIHFQSRRYDEAIAAFKRRIELDQNAPVAYRRLGDVYTAKGLHAQAIASYQEAIRLRGIGRLTREWSYLGAAYAKAGMRAQAEEILQKIKTGENEISSTELAVLYDAMGMRDEAFALLEKAYAERDPGLPSIAVDPNHDSLRGDSRFQDLLRRMGLQPQ